jgi:hypothetical protein
MGFFGTAETFAAYVGDTIDHAFGGSSNWAASLEADNDDALSAMGGSSNPDISSDVTAAENSTLPGGDDTPEPDSGHPWLKWAAIGAGGVVLLLAVGYVLNGVAKVKSA